jgi:competence protein ComEC
LQFLPENTQPSADAGQWRRATIEPMISALESLATGSRRDARGANDAPRRVPLVVVAVALAAGVVLNRYWAPTIGIAGFVELWLVACVSLVAWSWFWRGGRPMVSAWLLVASLAACGGAWHELRWNLFTEHEVARFAAAPTPACVRATVVGAPETLPAPLPTPLRAIPSGERCGVDVELRAIRDARIWLPAGGRCRLTVDGDLLAVAPGDKVQIFAQLRRPSPPMNPGEFDFAELARTDGRVAALIASSPDCVTTLATAQHWSPSHLVPALRDYGQRTLHTYIGPEQAGLASAVLLGMRDELPYEATMPFLLTGTVHLLVVSGLNVAILAAGLYWLAWIGWLPRRVVLVLTVAVVILYTLVAGAEPPVVRSAVLVVVICLGAWAGRRGTAYNSLAAAAVVALALNPAQLFQVGTQLSFLCVAILIWVGHLRWFQQASVDPLDRLIAATRPWYAKLWRFVGRWSLLLLVTSAAVWLFTLPLVLYRFHVGSPVALVISPVVWLIALVAMWAGFVTLACGWLMPVVAVVAGKVCGHFLGLLVALVNWAEGLSWGHFWSPGPALWWLVGFYLGLLIVMLWGRAILAIRWQVGLVAAWIVAGLVPPLWTFVNRSDELRCSFLAMGHGTCVVLEMPGGETLLYDAGSLGSPEFATQSVAGFLCEHGIRRIDGLILSHADVDHYNAVPGLLERFHVGSVYVTPLMFDWFGATGPANAPETLRQAIAAAGVPTKEIWSGDRLRVGEVTLEVLHPPRDGVIGSDNANSITLVIEYAGRRLLLPGDLETPGLEDMIAEAPVDCDILMAPHHGSRRSDPPGFAAWSTPEWVVLSGGADADPVVERTYAASGAKVLNTGKLGAIEFCIASEDITMTSFLGEPIR